MGSNAKHSGLEPYQTRDHQAYGTTKEDERAKSIGSAIDFGSHGHCKAKNPFAHNLQGIGAQFDTDVQDLNPSIHRSTFSDKDGSGVRGGETRQEDDTTQHHTIGSPNAKSKSYYDPLQRWQQESCKDQPWSRLSP